MSMIWYDVRTIENFKDAKENKFWMDWDNLEKEYGRYKAIFNLTDKRAENQILEAKAHALSYVKEDEISWYAESGKLFDVLCGDMIVGDIMVTIFAGIVTITDEFHHQECYGFISDEWSANGYRKLIIERYGEKITLNLCMNENSFKYYDEYEEEYNI